MASTRRRAAAGRSPAPPLLPLLFLAASSGSFLAAADARRIAFVSIPLHARDTLPAAARLAAMGHDVTVASASLDCGVPTKLEASGLLEEAPRSPLFLFPLFLPFFFLSLRSSFL